MRNALLATVVISAMTVGAQQQREAWVPVEGSPIKVLLRIRLAGSSTLINLVEAPRMAEVGLRATPGKTPLGAP